MIEYLIEALAAVDILQTLSLAFVFAVYSTDLNKSSMLVSLTIFHALKAMPAAGAIWSLRTKRGTSFVLLYALSLSLFSVANSLLLGVFTSYARIPSLTLELIIMVVVYIYIRSGSEPQDRLLDE